MRITQGGTGALVRFLAVALAAAAALAGSGLAATAEPDLEGVTGILNVPTAEVAKDGEFYIGFGRNENKVRYPGREQRNYFVGVGFLPRLEVVARYIDFPEIQDPSVPGFGTRKDRSVNAKLQLLSEDCAPVSVAAGMYDIGGRAVIERGTYGVISKTIGPARLTLGVGNKRLDGVFGGIEVSPIPELDLMYEYDTYDHNFGIRLNPHPDWHLTLGSVNDDFSWGVSYGKVLPSNRNPKGEPPAQRAERMPLTAGTEAADLDELANRLGRQGLVDVICKAREGELAVKYENRRFRHEEDAWAFVCLWTAVHAPDTVERLRVVTRREHDFVVTTEFARDDLLAYVNGEMDSAEFCKRVAIRDYRSPGYEYSSVSTMHAPKRGSTDVYFYPANALDLGAAYAPVRQRSGVGVKHCTSLAPRLTVYGKEEIPISNNLDNRDNPFVVRELLTYRRSWEPSFFGLVEAGYFGEHRWGGQVELRKYWDDSRFDLGVTGGWVRNKRTDGWEDMILASGSVRVPSLDLSLTGHTGRFLSGDEGFMLAAGRRFGGYGLEFFYFNTDYTENEAGVRFSIPIAGYSESAPRRFRVSVAPDFLYEYRTSAPYSAEFLHFRGSIDVYRSWLYPWHLREHLHLLRLMAGTKTCSGN
ncbi:YjbH domain-containing protein [bacterium]|nr:YjbH domain-containing protein [bacterium]